jgi:hypothetical protein
MGSPAPVVQLPCAVNAAADVLMPLTAYKSRG